MLAKELAGPEASPAQQHRTRRERAQQEDGKGKPLTSGLSLQHQTKGQAVDTPRGAPRGTHQETHPRGARALHRPSQECPGRGEGSTGRQCWRGLAGTSPTLRTMSTAASKPMYRGRHLDIHRTGRVKPGEPVSSEGILGGFSSLEKGFGHRSVKERAGSLRAIAKSCTCGISTGYTQVCTTGSAC